MRAPLAVARLTVPVWVCAALLLVVWVCAALLLALPAAADPVSLTPALGPVMDAAERAAYGLLPSLEPGLEAAIEEEPGGRYRLLVSSGAADARTTSETHTIPDEDVARARRHCELVQELAALRLTGESPPASSADSPEAGSEPDVLWRTAQRFALAKQYGVATPLLLDLAERFPSSPRAEWIRQAAPELESLQESPGALLAPGIGLRGGMRDRAGRTELLIFSGYYGVWLGVAAPVALDADRPAQFAAGLLLGAPLSMIAGHYLSREAEMGKGRAAMIALGGHLGTWQGIGWSVVQDAETRDAVGAGALGGLAGIAAASILTQGVHFREGPAEITGSGMPWGAWLGAVTGVMADHEGDALIQDMLIGSDVLVLGAGLSARNVEMSRTRVRLINLSGVLGTVFALGLDVLARVDQKKTVVGIAAAGSLAGLAAGTVLTREFDAGRELSRADEGVEGVPTLTLQGPAPSPGSAAARTTASGARIGVTMRF